MGRHRKDETEGGRWSVREGTQGSVVRVRERVRGGRVQLIYRDTTSGNRLYRYAEVETVRRPDGRIDDVLSAAALAEARALAARLRVARAALSIEPVRMTLAQGFARYHDAARGGMPASKPARQHHRAAVQFWELQLGHDAGWNTLLPSDVEAAALRLARAGKPPLAEKHVRCLRTVYRWLRDRAGMETLRDPTRGLELSRIREGHEVRRPSYPRDELEALVAVARDVDPRFEFALIWADDSGARSAALYRAMRSQVDAPLDVAPDPGQAPHGWANLPAMKGQGRALTFLTARQRRIFDEVTAKRWNGAVWEPGYLSLLEARWLASGTDYPLIPGGPFPRGGVFLGPRAQANNNTLQKWLREAEQRARVAHVPRRGWHGIRRAWARYTARETDMDTVVVAGAWSDRETPERTYVDRERLDRLAKARTAQERKHP
jgi:hypothetical protein